MPAAHAKTAPVLPFPPRKNAAASLRAFLAGASGSKPDSARDRAVALFRSLRETVDWHTYTADKELYGFLQDNVEQNPYIPAAAWKVIGTSEHMAKTPVRPFFQAWAEDLPQAPLSRWELDCEHMAAVIGVSPVLAEFSAANVHNNDYFFHKITEWYKSYMTCKAMGAKQILDVAGGNPAFFARMVTHLEPDAQVTVTDLGVARDSEHQFPRVRKLRTNAGDMGMLPDNSFDAVTSHCSLEHFENDSDMAGIREMHRLLRPGGVAIITPLHTADRYTIQINPTSCFFMEAFRSPESYVRILEEESALNGAFCQFAHHFYSPFIRLYDTGQLQRRLLDQAKFSAVRLERIEIADHHVGRAHPEPLFGKTYRYDIHRERGIKSLILTK